MVKKPLLLSVFPPSSGSGVPALNRSSCVLRCAGSVEWLSMSMAGIRYSSSVFSCGQCRHIMSLFVLTKYRAYGTMTMAPHCHTCETPVTQFSATMWKARVCVMSAARRKCWKVL